MLQNSFCALVIDMRATAHSQLPCLLARSLACLLAQQISLCADAENRHRLEIQAAMHAKAHAEQRSKQQLADHCAVTAHAMARTAVESVVLRHESSMSAQRVQQMQEQMASLRCDALLAQQQRQEALDKLLAAEATRCVNSRAFCHPKQMHLSLFSDSSKQQCCGLRPPSPPGVPCHCAGMLDVQKGRCVVGHWPCCSIPCCCNACAL